MAVTAMLSILPGIEECHVLNYVSLKNLCQGPNPQYLSMWPWLETGFLEAALQKWLLSTLKGGKVDRHVQRKDIKIKLAIRISFPPYLDICPLCPYHLSFFLSVYLSICHLFILLRVKSRALGILGKCFTPAYGQLPNPIMILRQCLALLPRLASKPWQLSWFSFSWFNFSWFPNARIADVSQLLFLLCYKW